MLARTALAVALLVGLTSCGTIPPPPSAAGTPVATRAPAGTAFPAPTAATTPAPTPVRTKPATPKPAPEPAPKPKPKPKPAPKPAPKPPPDSWSGTFHGQPVYVPHGHGARVSFTFDDGPWPGSTAQVLALLAQHHVHAVFCLIGDQARTSPALVRREVREGHELCDHSRDHDLAMKKKGRRYTRAEVADGLAEIRRVAPRGTRVRFYRQPGGLWNPTVVKAMHANGLDPLRWSDDPRDWSRPGSAVIVRRVVAQLHPGAVILMHDGGGDRSQSVEALRFLLGAVVAAGWQPVLAPHVRLSAKSAARPQ